MKICGVKIFGVHIDDTFGKKRRMIMPISELMKAEKKKIGIKQSTRALLENSVEKVFIAENADQHVTRRIINLAAEKGVEVIYVSTMHEIGLACKIDVGAATAVIIKE